MTGVLILIAISATAEALRRAHEGDFLPLIGCAFASAVYLAVFVADWLARRDERTGDA